MATKHASTKVALFVAVRSALFSIVAAAGGWLCFGCGAPETLQRVAYDVRFGDATTMDVYLPEH